MSKIENIISMKCHNCNHEWNYKGTSKHYVTCPNCRFKVKIRVGGTND